MVKHGQFSLSLIRAETGESYKEHGGPGGGGGGGGNNIYAEVEPEDEYYLKLHSDAPEIVYVDLKVDGTLIKRGHRVHPRSVSRVGVIRAADSGHEHGSEVRSEVALRFARAQVHDGLTKTTACAYWTGQVEAIVYGNPAYRIPPAATPKPGEGVGVETTRPPAVIPVSSNSTASTVKYGARKTTFYLNPSLASTDVGYVPGQTNQNQKKGVKSAEGTTALRQHRFSKPKPKMKQKNWDDQSIMSESYNDRPRVKEPEKLGSITLKYCSTVGLIHAGILEKPPNWDVEVLKRTSSKRTREEHARILSEVKVQKYELMSERINGQGEKVIEKKEMEVLDLTECE